MMKKYLYMLSFLLLTFSFLIPLPASARELVIIVNKNSSVTGISNSDLAAYYLKEKKFWPDGSKVTPIDRNEGSPERVLFLRQILGKSSREMAAYWIKKKQITGDSAPQQFSADAVVIQFVGSLQGAVGYVSSTSLTGAAAGKVKVIKRISE